MLAYNLQSIDYPKQSLYIVPSLIGGLQAPSVSLCAAILKLYSDGVDCGKHMLTLCEKLSHIIKPIQPPAINQEVDYNLVIGSVASSFICILYCSFYLHSTVVAGCLPSTVVVGCLQYMFLSVYRYSLYGFCSRLFCKCDFADKLCLFC